MIRHTVLGKDRRVLSVDAGFFDRLRYGFPKDKVYIITEAEKKQEKQRVAEILEKIEKTNGLPHVDIAFFRTDYQLILIRRAVFRMGWVRKTKRMKSKLTH